MRHDADLVSGPLYSYLGHFKQRQYLVDGHNTDYHADVESLIVPGAARTRDQNEMQDMNDVEQRPMSAQKQSDYIYHGAIGQDI